MTFRTAALAWMLAILAGMSIPAGSLPQSGLLTADKLLHFACFFLLTLFWLLALRGSAKRRLWTALGIGVAYGAATELYQGFMPLGRTADVYDLIADTAGCLGALAAFWLAARRKEKRQSNSTSFTVS